MRDGAAFVGPNRPQAAPMLTNRATAVLAEALQLARRTDQDAVSTEHLLLALLAESGAVPAILDALGVNREALRARLDEAVAAVTPATRTTPRPAGPPSLAAMRRTLELADAEARRMQQALGPEHLLLGILAQANGPGPAFLREGGASLESARHVLARPA